MGYLHTNYRVKTIIDPYLWEYRGNTVNPTIIMLKLKNHS